MRRLWTSWSLRTQVALMSTLVVLALLSGLSIAAYRTLRSFLITQTALMAHAHALSIIDAELDMLGPSAPPAEQTRLWQRVANHLTDEALYAVLYAPDGRMLAQSSGPRLTLPPGHPGIPPPEPDAYRVAREHQAMVFYPDPADQHATLILLFPLLEQQRVSAFVQVGHALTPTTVLLDEALIWLGLGTLLAALVAALLCFGLTHLILAPLRTMRRISEQVAQGDLTARIGLPDQNEVGALAQTFDLMVARLQATLQGQQRFLADAAHELRTPLTAMGGRIELLLLGAIHDPAEQQRIFHQTYESLERLQRLVNNLLLLSRMDSQVLLPRAWCDLAELARSAADELELGSTGHQLVLRLGPGRVWGQRDQLRQAVLNLLDNARKYTPPEGRITIALETTPAQVLLTIQDTGCGIPETDLPHVAERFYRGSHARQASSAGAGLGLAIVQGILSQHGGTLELHSHPGQGTTAALSFPRSADEQAMRSVAQGERDV
jgi:two-component system, OmpR family, sensor kinase